MGLLALAVAGFLLRHTWYTPTTTAYAVNDTAQVVTLDNCADTSVSLAPGQTARLTPFSDGSDGYCQVFSGQTDRGNPDACLYFPRQGGRTISGSTVRVSSALPLRAGRCAR